MLAGILYLLFAPATATSLAAGCTTVPPSASSPKLTKCKYLVLGGGPGGMFSAYLLRSLGRDVCVVERSTRTANKNVALLAASINATAGAGGPWGGKMQDYPGPDPSKVFGSCGLRMMEGQHNLR